MSRIISLTKIIATICLLAIAPVAQASRPVAADPNWIFHSSFDNMPRKIIDTPDAVYFFVHQRLFNNTDYRNSDNGTIYFESPTGAIFKLDKNNTAAGLQDLHKTIPFSGTDMRLFDVDPETGLMVIAYNDGGIDLITRDGKVTYISEIKNRTFPGSWVINSISFDPTSHNVWIGTGAGFIHISSATLSPVQAPEWDQAVSDICPVGQKVIAIIGNTICEAPAGTNIARRESYTPIAGVTTAVPSRLMPLSANHFAYLTTNGSIQLATLANGKWTRKQLLGATASTLQAEKTSVADRLEHALTRTANGYYVSGLRSAYLISRPADASGEPTYTKVTLPIDASLYSASYDLSNYWYYRDRGQFVNRHSKSASAWDDPTATYMVEAPLSCKDMYFDYSPEVGFIAINRDPGFRMNAITACYQALPAAYSNGKWKNLATVYNTPYLLEENPAMAEANKAKIERLAVIDPRGFAVDPVFPYIGHMGSTWDGIASVNLDDPKKLPVLNVSPVDPAVTLPVRRELERAYDWGNFTGTYVAGFDADKTLWVVQDNYCAGSLPNAVNINLYYWTVDARRESLENSDPNLGGKWGKIVIDANHRSEFWVCGQVLAHPGNRNKLLISTHGFQGVRPVFIFDHNGTPDNTADDRLIKFYNFQLPSGEIYGPGYVYGFVEDPNSGMVVASTFNNTYIFDPNTPLVNGNMPAESLEVKSASGSGYDFLAPFPSVNACFDEYGRLWLAGLNGGVVGMSADRKKAIAHFTTQNSPLPSDNIYGIGWNPDTKSLFVSTDMGIVEVRVDNLDGTASASGVQDPFMTPEVVSPDYSGTVAFHNIPAGLTLRVTDTEDRDIAVLPAPDCGVTYWNLLDKSGNRVPTGKYTISDATGNLSITPMTVVVTR